MNNVDFVDACGVCGLNRFYVKKKNTLAVGSAVVQKHTRYSVRVKHF